MARAPRRSAFVSVEASSKVESRRSVRFVIARRKRCDVCHLYNSCQGSLCSLSSPLLTWPRSVGDFSRFAVYKLKAWPAGSQLFILLYSPSYSCRDNSLPFSRPTERKGYVQSKPPSRMYAYVRLCVLGNTLFMFYKGHFIRDISSF